MNSKVIGRDDNIWIYNFNHNGYIKITYVVNVIYSPQNYS